MAISQSKYVNIVSSLGGGSSVNQRELIGRVFTSNYLVPVNRVIEFGGGASVALLAIGEYFGTTSDEYAFASKYFAFTTKANTQPQKLAFARYNSEAVDATLIGGKVPSLATLQAITAGTLTLTIDETEKALTGINLSSATSYSDVADLIETAINDSTTACSYDAENGRFNITAAVSLTYATGTVAEALGFIDGVGILSDSSAATTPLATVSASAELSNNFFSFCFLDNLATSDITEVAQWTHNQNVKYMYSVAVSTSNHASIYQAVKDFDGVALTLDKHGEFAQFMPMCAYAAVDYRKPNSTLDIFYKQFAGVTPSVATNTEASAYDALRINYYGTTQQAGQAVSFYQNGLLQGSIANMGVYANEAWLKDSFVTDVLNLRMGLDTLPANTTGKSLVLSALMKTVNLALTNGVMLAGKELNAAQKAYITTITGDEDGWISVQNAGYRLSAEVEEYQESGVTKYKISFLCVYSKGDTINYVDGRNILI